MVLIRTILVVVLTLTASLSGAAVMDHVQNTAIDHAAMADTGDAGPQCCDDSTERGPSCHMLPAVLTDTGHQAIAPPTGDALRSRSGVLLTGLEPTAPLDPPRRA